jgi:hypothetical protein
MTSWVPILVPLDRYASYAALVATDAATLDLPSPTDWQQMVIAASSASTKHAENPAEPTGSRAEALASLSTMPHFGEAELAAIADGTTETAVRWTKAMDFCSAHPGDFFTTTEVAEATGMTVNNWRDAPRKMYLVLRKIPGAPLWDSGKYVGQPAWPLLAWWFTGDVQVSWAISPENAMSWRGLRDLD